ncbi:MAG: CBS domain-containing protein [Gammaproteobacteria bacterium]|jgi:CBS domain-containing protein|nr:histidine kinase [Chromatiales bacterium]MDP6675227.1 CBS domain-containing protein [Gammaproteobacteria bacterium]
MRRIKELLASKGDSIWSVGPDQSVYEAIHLLAEKEIGALAVMDGDRLIGIVSERDYARQIILKGRSSETTLVKDIMTSNVVTANGDQGVRECMGRMTEKRIRHLPIVDNDGKLIGMISIGDLVRSVIAEQQSTIGDLEKYISG